MSERQGRRTNWICPETVNSRYPSPVTRNDARKARRWIASGKMDHAQAAERLGYTVEELIAATERKRGKGNGHGNAVLNVKPDTRDTIRDELQHDGEAMHDTIERLLAERYYYCIYALAYGCPPYSGLSPEPVLI